MGVDDIEEIRTVLEMEAAECKGDAAAQHKNYEQSLSLHMEEAPWCRFEDIEVGFCVGDFLSNSLYLVWFIGLQRIMPRKLPQSGIRNFLKTKEGVHKGGGPIVGYGGLTKCGRFAWTVQNMPRGRGGKKW
ncbi:hypothetical protein A2U01_0000983 [Trifolium medium]|uniref:Uncharacterized protein n=1 Tax=Trifolium medium TaxID=97028 RepID=A0A392LZQ1_9FABA|nr:hypothetical protein [Trifolium medium]